VTLPVFTIIAGPNGSGKSTLTGGNSAIFSQFPVLDPDKIATTIQPTITEASALAAGRQVLGIIARQLDMRQTFTIETTLSGKNYLRAMAVAQQHGFQIVLIYIGTESVEINLARVANRVLAGGHNVPEADVRRRYVRSFAHLPLAMELADEIILFDNSSEQGYQLIGVGEGSQMNWIEPLTGWAREIKARVAR
jgi:predicted ABC-type ATPase